MNNTYKQGEIVFIQFPFSDLQNTKRRPALIISKNNSTDIIFAKITSVISNNENSHEIKSNTIDFVLQKPSEIKLNFISTIEKSLIIKRIGTIKKEEMIIILNKIVGNFI